MTEDTATQAGAQAAPKIDAPPTICILGDTGIGKTRLSALMPKPYCLDVEDGAQSAFPPERRKKIDLLDGLKTVEIMRAEVNRIAALPFHDSCYWLNDLPIGAVVIDSMDRIQQTVKYAYLQNKRKPAWMITAKMEQQDWGVLLDVMMPLLMDIRKLRVPRVIIDHVSSKPPEVEKDILITPGFRGFSVQGKLADHLEQYMDYVLHYMLALDASQSRLLFVQPTMYANYRITAKDRHQVFKPIIQQLGSPYFAIAADANGNPTTRAMQVICDAHAW